MAILEQIRGGDDIRRLPLKELDALCDELRGEIVAVTAFNGGHVSSNLGVVELTVALHRAFDTPRDKLVWDTSHQCYPHKILTGRLEQMRSLRQFNGCCGFVKAGDSPYDCFGTGHAGTAISAALGMAAARDRLGGVEHVVAIVGDGSLNCGISLEGLNNVSGTTKKLIIILNDNKMSISPNVGGIAEHLNHVISARLYNKFKGAVRSAVLRVFGGRGQGIRRVVDRLEQALKSVLVPSVLFENLGVRYIGPINGHDIRGLLWTFEMVKEFEQPAVVHVVTEKGRGYPHAAAHPEKFHGMPCFDASTGMASVRAGGRSFSTVFGAKLEAMAESKPDVVAITAAMTSGTGLAPFAQKFPERFFDVGIAEEHQIVFAAGLAMRGLRPFAAVYSTFLLRALDCVWHDVCLQNLPVVVCADRAGVVEDGPTHHGIHDLSFLLGLPNLSVLSPSTAGQLEAMLEAAYTKKTPVVIRYPRGEAPSRQDEAAVEWGKAEVVQNGIDLSIWACGAEVAAAVEVAALLAGRGMRAAVVDVRFLKPFDVELLRAHASAMPVATLEDSTCWGGLAAIAQMTLNSHKHHGMTHFGWGDTIVGHGSPADLKKAGGLDPHSIADTLAARFAGKR